MIATPRLSKTKLLDKILSAIEESGWSPTIIERDHPFKLLVSKSGFSMELRVYVWNITRPVTLTRPQDEFRIQITSVDRIVTGTSFRTLLLGWDRKHEVFAGWNASRYETFGASPALQVKQGTLSRAQTAGLAIQPKQIRGRGDLIEVVVAFRPDFLGTYFANLDNYHRQKLTNQERNLLSRVGTRDPPSDHELSLLPEERRHAIRELELAVRNGKFRKLVLKAYDSKCGVCGLDLGIVEAAHIVPVAENGTDETSNGVALCANHHTAFDKNILTIKDDYSIAISRRRRASISRSELDKIIAGISTLTVPNSQSLKPKPEYLRSRMRIFDSRP